MGENCSDCTVLVEDLEGISLDFDNTRYGVDTKISIEGIKRSTLVEQDHEGRIWTQD